MTTGPADRSRARRNAIAALGMVSIPRGPFLPDDATAVQAMRDNAEAAIENHKATQEK